VICCENMPKATTVFKGYIYNKCEVLNFLLFEFLQQNYSNNALDVKYVELIYLLDNIVTRLQQQVTLLSHLLLVKTT